MYTVIVVDDEKSIRERLVSFLEKEDSGFRLLGSYENGYDALMYGVPQEPDLIVTDVKMPFVDGLELIKRAKEELPVVQSIIISGFDSFDYAKRAIELGVVGYISKPIDFDEVRACMEKVKASLDSYFKKEEPKTRESESIEVNLQKLLTMKNIDASFAKKLEEEGMPLKGNVAIVATFAPDSDEEESTYEDEEAMSKEISRLLEEEFADWRTYSFRLPPEKTVLFIQDGEYDCDDYVDRISRVLGRLKKSLGFTVSVGVSEAAYFNEPFSYRRLYRHSRRSLEYRSVMGKGIALYYEDLQKQPSPVGKVDENEYRKLTALVFEGKEDEIKEVLSSFVRRLFLPDFRESYYLILGNVVDSLLRGCLAIEKFYDGYMTHMEMNQRLYDCKDAACLLDKLELIMKRVLEINLEKRRGGVDAAYGAILDHIEEKFSDSSLSLPDVASALGYSLSYVSAILKRNGTSFTKALSSRRMEEAKKLLRETGESITSIASKVGYDDPYYFSHCFKKILGISPADYRKGNESA